MANDRRLGAAVEGEDRLFDAPVLDGGALMLPQMLGPGAKAEKVISHLPKHLLVNPLKKIHLISMSAQPFLSPWQVFSTLICAVFLTTATNGVEKPNFIIIKIDDLGYADIGAFGSKINRTPNLDRMAAEGLRLRAHYGSPACSPSRASLLTGCYAKRVLPIAGMLFPSSAVGLNPAEQSLSKLLKNAGYTTACTGKWHLGETIDVLAKHPAIEKDLLARIAIMHQDLGNEGRGPGVRPIGRVPSPRPLIAPAGP